MKFKLFLMFLLILSIFFGGRYNLNANYNYSPHPEVIFYDTARPELDCSLINISNHASFKYKYSTLFSTRKVYKPHLLFSTDTIINYNEKKYQCKIDHLNVLNANLEVGSISTANSSTLLVIINNHRYYFDIEKVGVFKFMGRRDDKYFFSFTLNKCELYFSFQFNNPVVSLIEYTTT